MICTSGFETKIAFTVWSEGSIENVKVAEACEITAPRFLCRDLGRAFPPREPPPLL
jgi:hypothetical protein